LISGVAVEDLELATYAASGAINNERTEQVRQSLRFQTQRSTYVMAKAIVGFHDLTPRLHGQMCSWIEGPTRRKLGLVPRDHLKSSVWTIADTVRRIAADANVRLLIGNETATNASHFLRRIQAVFERAPLFRWLYPELIPDTQKTKWSETEMLVPRKNDYPESTVEVIGVGGAVVSRHYKHIKLDDLVGKEASESVDVMRKTIDWYLYCESLLECPTDPIDTYGTRWTHKDLYAWIMEHESDIDIFHRKALDDGVVLWSERFPQVELERIRQKIGSFKFSCQYQNEPFDPEHMTFDPGWLRFYETEGWEVDNSLATVRLVGQPKPVRIIPVILTDPAISEKSTAARTAVVCAGLSEDERVFVLEAWAERCQPLKMIEKIFEMAERWDPMVVAVEGVAYQRALKGFIEAECMRRGKWLNVREVRPGSREGKESRIRGLQPYAQRGRLWLRRSTTSVLSEEFEAFPLGETVDVLDALSYGPQVWVMPDSDEDPRLMIEDEDDKPIRYEGINGYTGY
jgi:hypothetical protein